MPVLTTCVLTAVMHFEGLRKRAYWDHGSWAIGYGHHGADVHRGSVISDGRALMYLRQDVNKAARAVESETYGVYLTTGEESALVDFVFNFGEAQLAGSTLLRKIKRGDMRGAAREFPRWVHAGGHVKPGLVARRAEERRWFLGQRCKEGN